MVHIKKYITSVKFFSVKYSFQSAIFSVKIRQVNIHIEKKFINLTVNLFWGKIFNLKSVSVLKSF